MDKQEYQKVIVDLLADIIINYLNKQVVNEEATVDTEEAA